MVPSPRWHRDLHAAFLLLDKVMFQMTNLASTPNAVKYFPMETRRFAKYKVAERRNLSGLALDTSEGLRPKTNNACRLFPNSPKLQSREPREPRQPPVETVSQAVGESKSKRGSPG